MALAAVLHACATFAADYPERLIRVIVTFPPGGGTDIVARMIFQKVAERMGANFVIDNRGGAGGTIGTELAAKAPPDGYTIVVVSGSHTINPSLYWKLGYDTVRDFSPVSMLVTGPGLLVVHPSLPARTVKELIAGQVSLSFPTGPSAMPHVQSQKLRALGVTSAKRAAGWPDIPTIAEGGVVGFDASAWYGVLAPAGTPPAIVARLQSEIVAVLRAPDLVDKLIAQGLEPAANTPEEFARIIVAELAKWSKVVPAAGVKME